MHKNASFKSDNSLVMANQKTTRFCEASLYILDGVAMLNTEPPLANSSFLLNPPMGNPQHYIVITFEPAKSWLDIKKQNQLMLKIKTTSSRDRIISLVTLIQNTTGLYKRKSSLTIAITTRHNPATSSEIRICQVMAGCCQAHRII